MATLLYLLYSVLSMVVFSATAYDGELNVPGIPLKDTQALLRSNAAVPFNIDPKGDQKCKRTGFSCEDSCNSINLWYCAVEGGDPIVTACKEKEVCVDNFGGVPACKEWSTTCDGAELYCPESNKFYPNLADCNSYYFCNETKQANPMVCPQDFVYDPLRHNCGPRNQGLRCHTVQCSEQGLQVLPYPGDKSTYAICMLGELKIAECPDPEEFSPSQSKCTLTCRGRGKFPYRNDCRKFYHCERSNAEPVLDNCAPGTIFNQSNQSCEPDKCKGDCKGECKD